MIDNKSPILSVLLPVYNAEKYIAEAIQSILNQTYTDFELIIADDGSIDDSKKIISNFRDERIILSHNSINLGKVGTVNKLFSHAKGEFITVHDADDISLPGRFEKQMGMFLVDNKLIMNGCYFEEFSEKESRVVSLPITYDDIKERLQVESTFHGPTMIFRKGVIKKGSLYRDFFKDYNEDVDLAYRICASGKCENIPETLYRYRVNPDGLSKKRKSPELLAYSSFIIELYNQRLVLGDDCLDIGDENEVNHLWEKHIEHLKKNPFLVFDRNAGFFLSYKFHSKAFKEWVLLFEKRPLFLKTWRSLFYLIRKAFCLF